MTKQPAGRRPGRPNKNERYRKMLVSLSPTQAAWLEGQPTGISATIQRLIDQERKTMRTMTVRDTMTGQQIVGDFTEIANSIDAIGEPGASFGYFEFEQDGVPWKIAVIDYEMSVIYFTTIDWQGQQPEEWADIKHYRWVDEQGRDAIMLRGLPVLAFA